MPSRRIPANRPSAQISSREVLIRVSDDRARTIYGVRFRIRFAVGVGAQIFQFGGRDRRSIPADCANPSSAPPTYFLEYPTTLVK